MWWRVGAANIHNFINISGTYCGVFIPHHGTVANDEVWAAGPTLRDPELNFSFQRTPYTWSVFCFSAAGATHITNRLFFVVVPLEGLHAFLVEHAGAVETRF